jgi:preprotein translocase subunit SecY
METRKPLSHITAGLIIAGIVIAISMVVMMITKDPAGNPGSGWSTYLVIVGGLIFFINQYGKAHNYQMSFGDLFSYGFKTTTMYTVVFVGFLILFSLLFPDFKANAMEAARTQMEKQKGITEDQIEKSLEMVNKYFWVFAIGGTMLGFVIIGAIGSLLGAAITKKRPHNPFEQLPQ